MVTLPEQAAALPAADRERFGRLYSVTRSAGSLVPPPEMREWIERSFGSMGTVERQTVVKVLNRWTLEGALFNDLRARRPIDRRMDAADLATSGEGRDPFCHPLTGTPADTFGRIEGSHSITASNVAKYDGLHGVVIFEEHNPLAWTEDRVVDAFETAARWLREAHRAYPSAVYPFVMWNCLPRSGASIVHAHMQVTLGEGCPYARVELWRRAAEGYERRYGEGYLEALFRCHDALGLGGEEGGVRWAAHLTPVKEKELLLLAPALGDPLYRAVHRALRLYVDRLGVRAYNVAVYLPPLTPVEEDWPGFGAVARIVDRGDPGSATSDVGAMELFAQPVVASDPWRLAKAVRHGGVSNAPLHLSM